MSAIASTTSDNRVSSLRTIAQATLIVALLDVVIQEWLIFQFLFKTPLTAVLQLVASGLLGGAAFQGGLTTALLGLVLHVFIIFIIASIFILSAARIPLLRRYPIPASLLYGFGVFIVMGFIVVPLSAVPDMPMPPTFQLVELMLKNIFLVGLPLGIIVKRNNNTN